MEESGKLIVNGRRAPPTKRGTRRVGELEWRQREEKERKSEDCTAKRGRA